MNWPIIQTIAEGSVERILNALPEGLMIAFFAWILVKLLRKQNSGTRFAVWFLALISVATLPVVSHFSGGYFRMIGAASPETTHTALHISERWAMVVFSLWIFGACAATARVALGLWRVYQLRRSCTAITAGDLDPLIQKTVAAITASGSVAVVTSEGLSVPAAVGLWKQAIILPSWTLLELPAADLNSILLHEWAHLRRGDDWTNLIQKVVRAILFFHPAVWWIERQLSVEREMACDDAVLAETANPHGYATCLLSLLEKSLAHRGWSMAQAAVHRAREASLRLAKILDKNRNGATRVWKPAIAMVCGFAAVCLTVLPHAPQLVTVDRYQPFMASNPAHLETGSLVRSSFPAGQHSEFALPAISRQKPKVRASSRATGPQQSDPVQSSAQGYTVPKADTVIAVNTNLDQQFVPQVQTMVFVEATPYGNSAVPFWRIQVWRITVLTGMRERVTRVPVANSI